MDFKKTLIATSAICAVGGLSMATADAASKPKLSLSGYYEIFAGAADGDRSGMSASGTPTYGGVGEGTFNILHYGEIRFKVSGKTDSGMKWGGYFELPLNDNSTTNASKSRTSDEANLWLSGSWGKLEIGGQDGAHDKFYRGSEKLMHISPGMVDAFANTSSLADEKMSSHDTSDDSKITYYTPKISGFQAGYSYIPNRSESSPGDCRGSEGCNHDSTQAHEFGIQYRGKVGGGKLDASWGFGYLTTDNTSATESEFNWRAGVTYSQGPWSIGGGYRHFNNDGDPSGDWNDEDTSAWEIGAAYSGGRWEVAINYHNAEYEDAQGDTDFDQISITGAYNLGGGLTVSAGLFFYDAEFPTSSEDTDGTVGIVALGARF
ncbi:MAG: porin [Alphaproteobacteria bacterium]|nr:porin [Alphaproteobacteria bacterium]